MHLTDKLLLIVSLPALLTSPVVSAQTLTFSAPKTTSLPSVASSYIMPLDLNGDGNTDVAFDLGSTGYAYLGDGKGGLSSTPIKLSTLVTATQTLVDLNGDGKDDILTLYAGVPDPNGPGGSPGLFNVMLGDGKGKFTTTTNLTTAIADTYSYAFADFNHDGRVDIAFLSGSFPEDGRETSLIIYLNKGNGVFQEGLHQALEDAPFGIVTGDFNNDGKADVAWVDDLGVDGSKQAYALHYLYGNGNGLFQPDKVYTLDAPPILSLGAQQSTALLAADFNHDNRTDLEVILNPKTNSQGADLPGAERRFATLLAKQTEGFYWLGNISYSSGLLPIALDDYNGDGLTDMLFTTGTSYYIYRGKSDSTLGASEPLPSGLYQPRLVPLTKGGLPGIIDGNSLSQSTAIRIFVNTSKK